MLFAGWMLQGVTPEMVQRMGKSHGLTRELMQYNGKGQRSEQFEGVHSL